MAISVGEALSERGWTARRGSRRGARARRPRGSRRWLVLGRVKRAWRRQRFVFLGVVVLVSALGAYAVWARAAPLLETMTFFAPAALFTGFAIATLRELSRNTITSLSSLGRFRDFPILGAAPTLGATTLKALPPDQRTPLGCIALQPASAFATAFRDLQGALGPEQVVAFISAFPGEGASMAALCAAASATQQGKRVMLIDCDLRRRTFTSALEHEPAAGLLEAAVEPDHWRDFVDEEVETGFHFIPAARPPNAWRSLGGVTGLPLMLDRMRETYDLIVLDCPPALVNADGPVAARLADKCVIVVAWDATPISALRETLRVLRARTRIPAGIFVNRVPEGYRFGRVRPS